MGGGPSLVWHESTGPILVGTMADYDIVEKRNMQDLRHEKVVLSMMPRLETTNSFSTARATNAVVVAACSSNVVTCSANGFLTGPNNEKGAAYSLVSRVSGNEVTLAGSCDAGAQMVLPVVAKPTDKVEIDEGCVRISRDDSVVTVASDLEFSLVKTDRGDRAFSPIAGFLYAYLVAPVAEGREFSVRISVETHRH